MKKKLDFYLTEKTRINKPKEGEEEKGNGGIEVEKLNTIF